MNPFQYPDAIQRRHDPSGYAEYGEYKPWLRDEFAFQCIYCRQRERWSREGATIFGVDHAIPQSALGGSSLVCTYTNLFYACNWCNSCRQDVAIPVDPMVESFGKHIQVNADGIVSPFTVDGIILIDLFHMNSAAAIADRKRIFNVITE